MGIAHRDIKPDNLGVAERGVNDELHLVLFDFSLTRESPEEIRSGTPPYREPFLTQRPKPAWDVAAERYAAAVTLYEMATGTLPCFGDGQSDPAVIDDEATVEVDLLDPAVAFSEIDRAVVIPAGPIEGEGEAREERTRAVRYLTGCARAASWPRRA